MNDNECPCKGITLSYDELKELYKMMKKYFDILLLQGGCESEVIYGRLFGLKQTWK